MNGRTMATIIRLISHVCSESKRWRYQRLYVNVSWRTLLLHVGNLFISSLCNSLPPCLHGSVCRSIWKTSTKNQGNIMAWWRDVSPGKCWFSTSDPISNYLPWLSQSPTSLTPEPPSPSETHQQHPCDIGPYHHLSQPGSIPTELSWRVTTRPGVWPDWHGSGEAELKFGWFSRSLAVS